MRAVLAVAFTGRVLRAVAQSLREVFCGFEILRTESDMAGCVRQQGLALRVVEVRRLAQVLENHHDPQVLTPETNSLGQRFKWSEGCQLIEEQQW